jgi:two-component system, NarL family, nitrate/nitrite response regulator NarL
MNTILQLAILDDHQIVIDGLKLLLKDYKGFLVVAEANSAEQILIQLTAKKVDVLLTDITMPTGMSGYDLSLKIRKELPHIKILALSMSEDGAMINKMIDEAKVDGYIPKSAGQKELLTAIETIAAGGKYFSPVILKQYEVFQKIKGDNKLLHLTSRELEVIGCISRYYSNKQIANELFISERTVETHRKNIYRKTNTKGEASLIEFIKEHNIL